MVFRGQKNKASTLIVRVKADEFSQKKDEDEEELDEEEDGLSSASSSSWEDSSSDEEEEETTSEESEESTMQSEGFTEQTSTTSPRANLSSHRANLKSPMQGLKKVLVRVQVKGDEKSAEKQLQQKEEKPLVSSSTTEEEDDDHDDDDDDDDDDEETEESSEEESSEEESKESNGEPAGMLHKSPSKSSMAQSSRKSPTAKLPPKIPVSSSPRKIRSPSPVPRSPRKTRSLSPVPSSPRKSTVPSSPRKSPVPSSPRKSPVSSSPRQSPRRIPLTRPGLEWRSKYDGGKAAADALQDELQEMGYDLNCKSFITRDDSVEVSIDERYPDPPEDPTPAIPDQPLETETAEKEADPKKPAETERDSKKPKKKKKRSTKEKKQTFSNEENLIMEIKSEEEFILATGIEQRTPRGYRTPKGGKHFGTSRATEDTISLSESQLTNTPSKILGVSDKEKKKRKSPSRKSKTARSDEKPPLWKRSGTPKTPASNRKARDQKKGQLRSPRYEKGRNKEGSRLHSMPPTKRKARSRPPIEVVSSPIEMKMSDISFHMPSTANNKKKPSPSGFKAKSPMDMTSPRKTKANTPKTRTPMAETPKPKDRALTSDSNVNQLDEKAETLDAKAKLLKLLESPKDLKTKSSQKKVSSAGVEGKALESGTPLEPETKTSPERVSPLETITEPLKETITSPVKAKTKSKKKRLSSMDPKTKSSKKETPTSNAEENALKGNAPVQEINTEAVGSHEEQVLIEGLSFIEEEGGITVANEDGLANNELEVGDTEQARKDSQSAPSPKGKKSRGWGLPMIRQRSSQPTKEASPATNKKQDSSQSDCISRRTGSTSTPFIRTKINGAEDAPKPEPEENQDETATTASKKSKLLLRKIKQRVRVPRRKGSPADTNRLPMEKKGSKKQVKRKLKGKADSEVVERKMVAQKKLLAKKKLPARAPKTKRKATHASEIGETPDGLRELPLSSQHEGMVMLEEGPTVEPPAEPAALNPGQRNMPTNSTVAGASQNSVEDLLACDEDAGETWTGIVGIVGSLFKGKEHKRLGYTASREHPGDTAEGQPVPEVKEDSAENSKAVPDSEKATKGPKFPIFRQAQKKKAPAFKVTDDPEGINVELLPTPKESQGSIERTREVPKPSSFEMFKKEREPISGAVVSTSQTGPFKMLSTLRSPWAKESQFDKTTSAQGATGNDLKGANNTVAKEPYPISSTVAPKADEWKDSSQMPRNWNALVSTMTNPNHCKDEQVEVQSLHTDGVGLNKCAPVSTLLSSVAVGTQSCGAVQLAKDTVKKDPPTETAKVLGMTQFGGTDGRQTFPVLQHSLPKPAAGGADDKSEKPEETTKSQKIESTQPQRSWGLKKKIPFFQKRSQPDPKQRRPKYPVEYCDDNCTLIPPTPKPNPEGDSLSTKESEQKRVLFPIKKSTSPKRKAKSSADRSKSSSGSNGGGVAPSVGGSTLTTNFNSHPEKINTFVIDSEAKDAQWSTMVPLQTENSDKRLKEDEGDGVPFSPQAISAMLSADDSETWAEIADASYVVGKALNRIQPVYSDDDDEEGTNRMLMRVLSNATDATSLGDVEEALDVLKKHAYRLGIRETDLLMSVKSEDTMEESVQSASVKSMTLAEEIFDVLRLYMENMASTDFPKVRKSR